MKKTILAITCGLLTATSATAQQDTTTIEKEHSFTMEAQLQTRGEWRHGALPAENGEDEAYFVAGGTALSLDYQQKNLEAKIVPVYSGVWGSADNNNFDLQEAWLLLKHNNGLFAKLGRQCLSYDDERIIGDNDWAMAASSHDVLKFGYEGKRHQAHFILAFNQNNENVNGGTYYIDGAQPYKSMQTVWYHFDVCPQFGASLLFMNMGMQDLRKNVNQTDQQQLFGAFLDWHPKNFSLQASYYRQTGHEEYGLPIKAWMMSADSKWQINPQWKLNMGYFHMSGDEYFFVPPEGTIGMAKKEEVGGFNPIFGSHHQFYGAMDFFYVKTYYGGNTPGLQDFYIGGEWTPVKDISIEADYHYLASAVHIEDADRTLGHELEVTASWEFMKDVKLSAGYSFMHGTKTMEILKRTSDQNCLQWGWIMLKFSPKFFSINW